MRPSLDLLSARQRELLEAVAKGTTSSKELAREFGIAPKTIDNLLSNAAKILGVGDRKSASARYIELRQISPEPSPVRRDDLAEDAAVGSPEGTGAAREATSIVRKLLHLPPLGGEEHPIRAEEVTARILHVALLAMLTLVALVMFVLAFLKTFENLQ